jgi:hypothetical protein
LPTVVISGVSFEIFLSFTCFQVLLVVVSSSFCVLILVLLVVGVQLIIV